MRCAAGVVPAGGLAGAGGSHQPGRRVTRRRSRGRRRMLTRSRGHRAPASSARRHGTARSPHTEGVSGALMTRAPELRGPVLSPKRRGSGLGTPAGVGSWWAAGCGGTVCRDVRARANSATKGLKTAQVRLTTLVCKRLHGCTRPPFSGRRQSLATPASGRARHYSNSRETSSRSAL